MDILHLDGVVGGLIFIATVIFFVIVLLISLAVYVFQRKLKNARSKWTRYFLWSAIILLLFDGVCFLLFIQKGPVPITRDEGAAFDYRMLTIWIPCHIAAYFLIAFGLRFLYRHKEQINKYIDKYR